MFENLLFQPASQQLSKDICEGQLPNALLFVGAPASGKLTCALELARTLACTARPAGAWQCNCDSCLKHKSLVSTSVLLTGNRSCSLEIAAAAKTFLDAVATGASHLRGSRYLFVRSIRKLSARFNPILWEGEDKVSKIAPILASIDENLEELERNPILGVENPDIGLDFSKVEKLVAGLRNLADKLESGFMYDAIPVAQMRRVSSWARYKPEFGKKVIILENADKMQEGSRNAMLKILEEPPEDVVFILTTTRRNAVMPTILSRVRPYNFVSRDGQAQSQVISRVFHCDIAPENIETASIQDYLLSFLPVSPQEIEQLGHQFIQEIMTGNQVNIESLIKRCGGFEPRLLLSLFLASLSHCLCNIGLGKDGLNLSQDASTPESLQQFRLAELSTQCLKAVHECNSHITIYNQGIAAALELLVADISLLVKKYRGGAII
ncbi:MAG: DNA polymerase III [Spirochaetaceae bacterium]|nr:DNA polymerase III [Spirochaetaceae bacterium]